MYGSAVCVNYNLLLHAGEDSRSLVVWDLDNQKELGRLVGHDAEITAVAARGNLAVSAQTNRSARLWNLETMPCTATLPGLAAIAYACCLEGK